jgi:putative oxidoreductase
MAGDKYIDQGLLIIRIGIGTMFAFVHGWPKVTGGPELWTGLGGAFGRVSGVQLFAVFWGFMAMAAEFGGGLLLISGLLFRPACAAMLFTMCIAVTAILRGGYEFSKASQPVELGIVLAGLLLAGPGRFTVAKLGFRAMRGES